MLSNSGLKKIEELLLIIRVVWLILTFFSICVGSVTQKLEWPQGESFLHFLEHNRLPLSIYWNLDKEDKEVCEEIRAGATYYVMQDDNSTYIEQALIPINEELQIHIKRDKKGNYSFEMIPIAYEKITESFAISIDYSPYSDIKKATNNGLLAKAFVQAYANSINFRSGLRKGDKVSLIYTQKLRLGRPFGMPIIKAAMVQTRRKPHYIFRYKGRYFDDKAREIENFVFRKPVNNVRITSRFTLKRWHPILHRYRAHLGVDFGGRTGTPVYAAADGRVIFAGRLGGYGNVIKIRHIDGFLTLYAHLHKFKTGIRRGKYVKKGQVIGYIGSTGMSTGPHLHFGLYKNGRPINPLGVIRITKKRLYGKRRKEFIRYANNLKKELRKVAETLKSPRRLDDVLVTRMSIKGK